MLLPIRTEAPLRSTPYTNRALILLNLAVFIAQLSTNWVDDHCKLDPVDPRLWQFFTYQFLHGGFWHIAGNMLFLYIFGNNVNDRLGDLAYLAFYLAGGVFAGLTYLLFRPDMPVIGASGSVSAVTGAFLVLFPLTKVKILFFFIIIGVYEISSMWLIIAFFVMDLGRQFAPSSFGGGDNVANSAHIGGTLFGVAMCMLLLWFRLLPRDLYDVVALLDRWNRRRQFRDSTRNGYDPFGYMPRQVRERPDPRLDQIQDLRAGINEAIAHNRIDDAARQYLQLLAIDADQVLSRQNQLDLANYLYSHGKHGDAAKAYELYLKQYSRGESVEQVQLMLGLIYARYLNRPDRARELLTQAAGKLHNERELAIAREELARLPAASV